AFSYAGLEWRKHVQVDPRYFRPLEVEFLLADASKARQRLSWDPQISFRELVRIMVDADMEAAGLHPIGEGMKILQARFSGWHQWGNAVSQIVQTPDGRAFE
ncbi:MAG: GDP-mannose 4,6-dehydratase, partial [bacterium]